MPFNRTQVENVRDALDRALSLDAKATRVETAAKIQVDDVDDFAITNPAQVTAYVSARRTQRDNLDLAVKPVVAGWS